MESLTLGRLKVRMVRSRGTPPEGASSPPLVVVLAHGFGAAGDDLVGLADALEVPPGTVLVFPEALHSLRQFVGRLSGDARAWWMIDMPALERAIGGGPPRNLTKEAPVGLEEAREAFVGMLAALGEIVPLDRLVLGGFSQGSMLALDVALRDPRRMLAGLVLLSTTFLAENEWTPLLVGLRGRSVFQSHGTTDQVLPYSIAERLTGALTEAGVDVAFEAFAGGHTIPFEVLSRLGAWLRALP
jgi:phospholipase/carboxylesterase